MSARDDIVQAARRLFYTHGFETTSLADLAAEAGVPKGNFYYHFKSKDDVLHAVVEARRKDIDEALSTWAASIPSPHKRVRRFVEMLMREGDDLVTYGCPTGSLLTELGKRRTDLKPGVAGILQVYIDFVATQLREAGVSRAKAEQRAQHLMGRCQGAILVAHGLNDAKLLQREVKGLLTCVDAWFADS